MCPEILPKQNTKLNQINVKYLSRKNVSRPERMLSEQVTQTLNQYIFVYLGCMSYFSLLGLEWISEKVPYPDRIINAVVSSH